MRIETTSGLAIRVDEIGGGAPAIHVEWDEHDWFGPGRLAVASDTGAAPTLQRHRDRIEIGSGAIRASVRVDPDATPTPIVVFRIEATDDLELPPSGAFDRPTVGWPVFTPSERASTPERPGIPHGARALAFQCCEFGLPTNAGPSLDGFFLLPHRPPTGWPLLVTAPDGRTLLLAPLDQFHDQTVGLNGGTVRCGWHGDLRFVPRGSSSELALIPAGSPRAAIEAWGSLLLRRAGTVRPGRWADSLATRPSYWTDNGSAYWYRTEPGHDVAGSIVAAVDDLRARGVPLGAVQLDSWWYPHAELRPFDTDQWVVPPTAMVRWEERPDVLPDGIGVLRDRLGRPPLVAHIRHLSSRSDVVGTAPVHVDGECAAPATSEPYERWLDQCVAWGVETFEHDWLVEVWFGVRGLREGPGRARAWQEGIDRAARERGITLQWCMGTPADLAQTVTLTQVTSVRTCGDHGYIATAGQLWAWFCTTNVLARALGLMPFKDVFRADPEVAGTHGEPEALLSALSTGPVGLGDRVGRFDAALALRTCRADGVLVKPHVPIAATSRSMLANAGFRDALMVAECWSDHPAGRWAYVMAMRCSPGDGSTTGEVLLQDLGDAAPTGDVVAWDWRQRTATGLAASQGWSVTLAREEWTFHVVAPVLPTGIAVIGDTSKFVTAGDARIRVASTETGARLVVLGAGESVTITGWSSSPLTCDAATVDHDTDTGVWTCDVVVPARGWTSVDLVASAPPRR